MVKKLALLASAFALLAFTAAAEQACKSAPDLSWLLAPLAAPETGSQPPAPLDLADTQRGATHVRATCTADCSPYASVTCSYTPPTSCVAVDRNCGAGQTGYVRCGTGPYIFCDPPCPECTNGQIQWIPTGGCCQDLTEKDKYKCINEQWVYQGTFCKVPLCGPV